MPDISRRRFLRDASLSAAAVGTVAVVGPSALGMAAGSASAAPVAVKTTSHGSATGDHVIAHVVNDESGTISLYVGTKKVTFEDHALSQKLLEAAR